ncbi:MAG: leucyl aminopeptidase family protein, partial [Rhodospirillaceae bacterium]
LFAAAASGAPKGTYRIDPGLMPDGWTNEVALAWSLADYRFDRYRKSPSTGSDSATDTEAKDQKQPQTPKAKLIWPEGADREAVRRLDRAERLVRDLVNTPAEDMGPQELTDVTAEIADRHGAALRVTMGDGLLRAGFPMIHAVGRASDRPPRLIDLKWGDPGDPAVTLVGKGVCFDSGGLDIKPAAGMRLMKKDMGGAAHALALAELIMDSELPIRLRLLIPAVDNAISGNAFRPGDILRSRKGLSVEIGNTDAEGRLVLADALACAAEGIDSPPRKPELILDCATLTGAARVALGPDLPALYCSDDHLAHDLLQAAQTHRDPLWLMPLHAGYRRMIESKVADLNNAPDGPFAGSITAALFLKAFVPDEIPWVHLDVYAWNPRATPGRSEGGAAQGLRTLFETIRSRFGKGQ